MAVIEYPPKPFYKCTRQQLIQLAEILEEQRDRARSDAATDPAVRAAVLASLADDDALVKAVVRAVVGDIYLVADDVRIILAAVAEHAKATT